MKNLFAVLDVKVSEYGAPFACNNAIEAMRSVFVAVNDKNTQIGQFPEDFHLYQVGSFDSVTGKVSAMEPPKLIAMAQTLLKKEGGKDGNFQSLQKN